MVGGAPGDTQLGPALVPGLSPPPSSHPPVFILRALSSSCHTDCPPAPVSPMHLLPRQKILGESNFALVVLSFILKKNIDVFLLSLLTDMGPSLLNKIHLTSRVAPAASYLAPC